MKLFNILTLALLIALLVLPFAVSAEDETPLPVDAGVLIPPLLVGLIAANNRATEGFKLYLSSPQLPYTPAKELRSFLTLIFSVGFGIASAWLTPDATNWLGAEFEPLAAILVTGITVSLGGGTVHLVLSLLQSLKKTSV